MYKLVLLRHGESTWNKENKFTGWTDVGLSETGLTEAKLAGQVLKAEGYDFDVAFTSVLKRAIHTLWIVQMELDLTWIPVQKFWQLNERHYGALQGLNKSEMAAKYGEEQVFIWRRSFDVRPPALTAEDPRHPGHDRRYKDVPKDLLPSTEALADTIKRVVPWWEKTLAPALRSGQRVLVSAHGNSLRALIKHLDRISNDEIMQLNIPTAIPLVYELDANLKPLRHYYLGDPEQVKAASEAVRQQGKKK